MRLMTCSSRTMMRGMSGMSGMPAVSGAGLR
jgi:hypothetical protein